MKTMLLFDLHTTKKIALQQLAVCLVIGCIVSVGTGTAAFIVPLLSVSVPLAMAFTLLSLDERAKWEQFRLALPMTRGSVVRGRYASLALYALYGIAIGLIIVAALQGATAAFPRVGALAALNGDFAWETLPLLTVVSLLVIAVILGIVLPFVARFGMTKAVRWIPLSFVALTVIVVAVGGDALVNALQETVAWACSPEGMVGATALCVAAAAGVYALSCAVSCKLYETREF